MEQGQDLARSARDDQFLSAVKSAPVMLWICGPDKRFIFGSESWLAFTGRTIKAELGDGWTEGIHRDDLEEYEATFTESFDRRVPFQRQYRLRRHDGEYRLIFELGVPRFDQEGKFLGYMGSCVDVTERKGGEEARSDLAAKILAGQERERERIARELHDDINQRVALLAYQVKQLERSRWTEPAKRRRFIQSMSEQLTELASDIQTISHRLHSSHLEYLGLVAAAEILCRDLRARHGVKIEFIAEGIRRDLPKDVSLTLYRVLQEGLQNAIKHSKAELFQVELVGNAGEVRLTIRDNGVGFDLAMADHHEGLGLISMRERVQLVHGDFSLESAPGSGTAILCKVSIEKGGQTGRAH